MQSAPKWVINRGVYIDYLNTLDEAEGKKRTYTGKKEKELKEILCRHAEIDQLSVYEKNTLCPQYPPSTKNDYVRVLAKYHPEQSDNYRRMTKNELFRIARGDDALTEEEHNQLCPDPHNQYGHPWPHPKDVINMQTHGPYFGIEKTAEKGFGVFAMRQIKKGQILGEMHGIHMSNEVLESQVNMKNALEYTVQYETTRMGGPKMTVYVSPEFTDDGVTLKGDTSIMFYMNEPSGKEYANVVFLPGMCAGANGSVFTIGVWGVACRQINEGSELLVHYGDEYVRNNYTSNGPCPQNSLNRSHNVSFFENQKNGKRKPDEISAVFINYKLPSIYTKSANRFIRLDGENPTVASSLIVQDAATSLLLPDGILTNLDLNWEGPPSPRDQPILID